MPWAALDLRGDEQPRARMCSNNTDSQMEFGLQPPEEDDGQINYAVEDEIKEHFPDVIYVGQEEVATKAMIIVKSSA